MNSNPEARFWKALGSMNSEVPTSLADCRAKMRDEFTSKMRSYVSRELERAYVNRDSIEDVFISDPIDDDDTRRRRAKGEYREKIADMRAISHVIECIQFNVKSISGGSLEVVLFVIGFAKLVQTIGISPEEFSQYMGLVAPAVMSSVFGVKEGMIAAEATPEPLETTGKSDGGTSGGKPEQKVRIEPTMASLYFLPALFAAAAVGLVAYAFLQISSQMLNERVVYNSYLHDHMESISKERQLIAEKISSLVAQRDLALETAQKTLFENQMALIKDSSAAAVARDLALIELVKTRLVPAPNDNSNRKNVARTLKGK
jgi:hypothetical protein